MPTTQKKTRFSTPKIPLRKKTNPHPNPPHRTIRAHDGAATSVVLSPGGHYVATGSHTGEVRVWSTGSGRLVQDMPHAHESKHHEAVHALAWSAGFLVSGGADAVVAVYGE